MNSSASEVNAIARNTAFDPVGVVHLSFHRQEFSAFLECLNESYKNIWGTMAAR